MSDEWKVEVHLAIVATNIFESSKTRFALMESSLPFRELRRGGSSFGLAKDLFKDITGCDANSWFIIKQVGVIDQVKEGTIIILYAILIPDLVPLLDGNVKWVDFDMLTKQPALLDMVGKACNYYRNG